MLKHALAGLNTMEACVQDSQSVSISGVLLASPVGLQNFPLPRVSEGRFSMIVPDLYNFQICLSVYLFLSLSPPAPPPPPPPPALLFKKKKKERLFLAVEKELRTRLEQHYLCVSISRPTVVSCMLSISLVMQ